MTESSSPPPEPEEPPSRPPLGVLAAVALVAGIGAVAVGSFAMVFGATGFFCPVIGIGVLLVAQVAVAKLFGMPVRDPETPMGVAPDDLD